MIYLKNFLSISLLCYRVIGINLLDILYDSKFVKLQRIFLSVNLVNLNIFLLSQFILIYQDPHNLLNGSALPFFYLSIFYGKLVSVFTRRDDLCRLVLELNKMFPRSKRDKFLYNYGFYEKRLKIVIWFLLAANSFSVYTFILAPLIQSFVHYYQFGTFAYHSPTPTGINDFQDKWLWIYCIVYFHQAYAIHVCSTGIIASDLLLCHLVSLLCMLFDYIGKEFRNSRPGFYQRRHLKSTIELHNKILR